MASSLRNTGKGNTKRPRPDTGTPPSPNEANLISTFRSLMDQQTERIEERFSLLENNLEKQVKDLQTSFSEIKASIIFQSQETEELKERVKKLERRVEEKETEVKEEVDKLAMYIARENLVFIGIPEKEQEDVRNVLKDFYINNLKLSEQEVGDIEYQRVHRLNAKSSPRPIKARFVRYADRETIMKNAKKLKGTKMVIREDIPLRFREARRAQLPALIAARNAGKLAYFSRSEPGKLFIDKVWLPVNKQKEYVENLQGQQTGRE